MSRALRLRGHNVDLPKTLAYAEANGWSIERTTRHVRFRKPGRRFVHAALTSSCKSVDQNVRSDLRRADREGENHAKP